MLKGMKKSVDGKNKCRERRQSVEGNKRMSRKQKKRKSMGTQKCKRGKQNVEGEKIKEKGKHEIVEVKKWKRVRILFPFHMFFTSTLFGFRSTPFFPRHRIRISGSGLGMLRMN